MGGVKASNYFMPANTLSEKGPGGGGWIHMNKFCQVTDRQDNIWGQGNIFAIGDCNYGCIGGPADWDAGKGLRPMPKISYPAEEQAVQVSRSIAVLDKQKFGNTGCTDACCIRSKMVPTWWIWGSGMFITSLGPHDAIFVFAANHNKGSGYIGLWGWLGAIQKELVETTKIDECKDNFLGTWIWHYVHHTPIQLWGKGPFFP